MIYSTRSMTTRRCPRISNQPSPIFQIQRLDWKERLIRRLVTKRSSVELVGVLTRMVYKKLISVGDFGTTQTMNMSNHKPLIGYVGSAFAEVVITHPLDVMKTNR